MKWLISAGETSGDIHGSLLMIEIAARDPQAEFQFLGGAEMERVAGHKSLIPLDRLAYMGFSEVLRHLGDIRRNFAEVERVLDSFRPDAVVCVDYPGFNLKLARKARRKGIAVFYYIAPKVWAWKEWRVPAMRRDITRLYSILPFEPEWFGRRGVETSYVGNPSVEEVDARLAASPSHDDFCRSHSLDSSAKLLALVPGSRVGEIRCNLPVMAEVARRMQPEMTPVIAVAPSLERSLYLSHGAEGIAMVEGDTLRLMQHAGMSGGAALVTSGTATLEAALADTPQVVCYRANGSALSYKIMRRLIKVDYVSLPNLITGRNIIPEMLLHNCTPDLVERELRLITGDTPGRRAQLEDYREMRRLLAPQLHAAQTAAADMVMRIKALKESADK